MSKLQMKIKVLMNGVAHEVDISISEPFIEKHDSGENRAVQITLAPLFEVDKPIRADTNDEAIELGLQFIEMMLSAYEIVDEIGATVSPSEVVANLKSQRLSKTKG